MNGRASTWSSGSRARRQTLRWCSPCSAVRTNTRCARLLCCVAVRIVVSAQVQKLWTKIIKAEKSLGWKAFVFVNLREFLPQFLPEHTVVPALQDAESSPAGARAEDTKPTGRRLDFATWLLAWRQYTPAAVATEQLELVDAVQHEQVVAEVAAQGRNDGYSPFLGVCYDEVARCGDRSSHAALMCSCVCKA